MNRFRSLSTLSLIALLAGTAVAQNGNYPERAAIFVRADGNSPVTNTVSHLCSDPAPFDCTPLQLNAQAGDVVDVSLLGTRANTPVPVPDPNGPTMFSGLFVLQASGDVQSLQCLQVPITGFVNSLILPVAGNTFTVAAGFMSVDDRGRCNGGYLFLGDLFTIPVGIPPGVSVALQGLCEAPLDPSGVGFAFTKAVVITTV